MRVLHTAVFGIMMVIGACTSDQDKKQAADSVSREAPGPDTASIDTASTAPVELPYEAVYNEQTQQVDMKPAGPTAAVSLEQAIAALNKKYSNILIGSARRQNDTLMVTIPNATALTQEMGTMGANIYLAESTFAFTAIPGIKVVRFDFKEGDHAVPGAYTRESFKDLD